MARDADTLYTGTGRYVVALRRQTGAEVWRTKLPNSVSGVVSLLLHDRELFVGHSGYVYCLDADTGRIMWENGLPRTGYNPVIMTMAGTGGSAAVVVAAHLAAAAAAASSVG